MYKFGGKLRPSQGALSMPPNVQLERREMQRINHSPNGELLTAKKNGIKPILVIPTELWLESIDSPSDGQGRWRGELGFEGLAGVPGWVRHLRQKGHMSECTGGVFMNLSH